MVETHDDPSLFAECLAAMAASNDAYPCDLLAPRSLAEFTLLETSPTPRAPTAPLRLGQGS